MATANSKYNPAVTAFLDDLNHPLREQIEMLRMIILDDPNDLDEGIKWNGPNYSHRDEDRITMRIQPPKQVQLIFHRGAKKLSPPKQRLIADDSGLLAWKENDRAVASFKSVEDIRQCESALRAIVTRWIAATQT